MLISNDSQLSFEKSGAGRRGCKLPSGRYFSKRVLDTIPDALKRKLQSLALKTHQSLQLRDFSRVDFMVDKNDHPFVLEANSIPGFTELSLLPKAAKEDGISFDQLCLQLVKWACLRSKKTYLIQFAKNNQGE